MINKASKYYHVDFIQHIKIWFGAIPIANWTVNFKLTLLIQTCSFSCI
uniref:Uncharacterized protein n=1 Tax=Arundo donax TaxID=35708 RepID=A0A0A9CTW9_ARUDO